MIVCMTWLLQIVGALTAPTSMALTCRVEEPSTASFSDLCAAVEREPKGTKHASRMMAPWSREPQAESAGPVETQQTEPG